ncbi:glycosyltransferase family 76 protein [Amylocystis lapponica]|nr:glycosyltransferase family 76 protein [Amylocystis lapponica]
MARTISHHSYAASSDRLRILSVLSLLTWVLSAVLVYLASFLPLFDSSPRILLSNNSPTSRLAGPLLRWDTFHFAHIASSGYTYEYEWAFFSGTPLVMRTMAYIFRLCGVSPPESISLEGLLVGGALIAAICGSTTTLYRLTLHHMRSPSVALLAALLSLLPSSPATLRLAGYTEPFFTYLSYKGMLCCTRFQWFRATCYFALAGTFRSAGIMLGGFILWGLLIGPFLSRQEIPLKRVMYAVALTALIFLPFVTHQYTASLAFCGGTVPAAPWCNASLPSIYGYAQAKYWNVGFLRYWTPQQLPNFILCAPVLLLLFAYTTHYIRRALLPRLRTFLTQQDVGVHLELPSSPPFLSASLAPHVLHALVNTLILLFAAHTQIILRVAATMPTTYWAAAWLVVERPVWGRRWVAWSVLWGVTSIVLWTTFLPPA